MNKLYLGLFDCHSGTEVQIRTHFLSEVTTIAHMLPVVSAQRPGEWTVCIFSLLPESAGPLLWESCLNMFHCNSGNLLETCSSDRSSSEGKTACQKLCWVITAAWSGVCSGGRFKVSFSSWKQQLSRRVIGSLSETPKNPVRLTNSKRPGIFDAGAAIHHSSALGCCSSSCANSLKRKIYIPG